MSVITAVIPVFNRAGVVSRAVDSVLNQDLPADCTLDVIVVDDGSTDDLASALNPYRDRIRIVHHAANAGASAARNTGIAEAAEGFVAFLDSDDIWLPGKLVTQMEAMRTNRWRASCTAFHLVRHRRPPVVSPFYGSGVLRLADHVWGCFFSPGTTMLCERALLDSVGPFDTGLRRLEDWDWFLRFGRTHDLGFIAKPLARRVPSERPDLAAAEASVAAMRAKHMHTLTPQQRRHFAAGLDLVLAGINFEHGRLVTGSIALAKSVMWAPIGHAGLRAVLHNRFARA
jgi:glycosyltransferase involved in cell wall biosynthesis